MRPGTARVSPTELAKTCHKIPALLSYRVRCGKPNCRCNDGPGHGPYWFLRWRGRDGSHRRSYVRATDADRVRAILAARRAQRRTERSAHARAKAERRLILTMLRGLR